MDYLTIGLFGTCGKTIWRKRFVEIYDGLGINYFNPQVEEWTPDSAELEAEHLANDKIVLFPITHETYGIGSLTELGFGILNSIKLENRRDFVILIEDTLMKLWITRDWHWSRGVREHWQKPI